MEEWMVSELASAECPWFLPKYLLFLIAKDKAPVFSETAGPGTSTSSGEACAVTRVSMLHTHTSILTSIQ